MAKQLWQTDKLAKWLGDQHGDHKFCSVPQPLYWDATLVPWCKSIMIADGKNCLFCAQVTDLCYQCAANSIKWQSLSCFVITPTLIVHFACIWWSNWSNILIVSFPPLHFSTTDCCLASIGFRPWQFKLSETYKQKPPIIKHISLDLCSECERISISSTAKLALTGPKYHQLTILYYVVNLEISKNFILLLQHYNCFTAPWTVSGTTHVSLYLHLFNSPLPRTTWVSQYPKGKTNPDLLKQEIVSGSGISGDICKCAPWPRHITTPASHHSSFLQAGCPSCRPTNSVNALKANVETLSM